MNVAFEIKERKRSNSIALTSRGNTVPGKIQERLAITAWLDFSSDDRYDDLALFYLEQYKAKPSLKMIEVWRNLASQPIEVAEYMLEKCRAKRLGIGEAKIRL